MKTDNIVESLQKYGIRAAAYKVPPIGKDVFALTIHPRHKEGVVLVNHGQAEIDVCGSRKLRQAAVTVREKGRRVIRSVMTSIHRKTRPPDKVIKIELRRRFNVIMPVGATWTFDNLAAKRGPVENPSHIRWIVTGTVTAEVIEPTVNHFLIGMDETRNFISPISRHVTTVRGAHRILRPDGARKKTLRQGEWFFVPCTCKQLALLDDIANTKPGRIQPRVLGDTTHLAKSSIRGPGASIWARGYVTDRRQGHHKSLFLPEWHRVVKNKEAAIKVASFQRDAVRRRRNTWD